MRPCRPHKIRFSTFSRLDTLPLCSGLFQSCPIALFSFSLKSTPPPDHRARRLSLSPSGLSLSLSLSLAVSATFLSPSLPPRQSTSSASAALPLESGRAVCPCLPLDVPCARVSAGLPSLPPRHPQSLTPSMAPPPGTRLVSGYLVCYFAKLFYLLPPLILSSELVT